MNPESLQSDWAMWLALGAIVIAVLVLIPKLLKMTSRSKLKLVVGDVKAARKEFRKVMRKAQKAEKRVEKLLARANRVKPRVLQEAKEAFEDAKALANILHDKVMVAENHVRRVIHDEYPPADHERMRAKHLPQDVTDKRPFSF
jgi:exonuclease VII small subunit